MMRAKAISRLSGFRRSEDGATLVEFAIVLALFLFIFFALIDFGRLAFHWVVAERALNNVARIATVRPAICPNVPTTHNRGANTTPRFGSTCGSAVGTCSTELHWCTLGTPAANATAQATALELWNMIRNTLPTSAGSPTTAANVRITYASDPALGFLGGPFTPIVTVELQNVQFEFATPLAGLARLAGATVAAGSFTTVNFPNMSVSIPGEDLALGNSG